MGNNNNVNKDNDTRKIITMIVMICTLMLGTTGATYAYFALSATNNTATGTAATASLTLAVTPATLGGANSGSTQTNVMVPQKESALGTAMGNATGNDYKCVDGNGNTVCKVYTITVTNTSTAAVKVNGTIQFSLTGTNAEMKNLKWRMIELNNGNFILGTNNTGSYAGVAIDTIDTIAGTTTIDELSTIYDLVSGNECNIAGGVTSGCTSVSLAKTSGSATYHIVVWINETNSSQTDSGTWRAAITFQGENGAGITSTITS